MQLLPMPSRVNVKDLPVTLEDVWPLLLPDVSLFFV